MPNATPKICESCRKAHSGKGWICDKCAPAKQTEQREDNAARMRNDPIWELYRNPRWAKFVAQLKANGNLFCQRIVDGARCTAVAKYSHHLISPRQNPALFVDHRNVVRVCHEHHPPEAGDGPENEYVPTLYTLPGQGLAVYAWYPQPGDTVRQDCPRWTCANVYARVAGVEVSTQNGSVPTSSSVPSAAITAALQGVESLLDVQLPGTPHNTAG